MPSFTGKNLHLDLGGTAINADYREFNIDEEVGIVDQSAGSDTARTYLTTLEDASGSLMVVDQADGTAATYIWNLLDKGTEGTLTWGPEGTATGKPKHSANVIITSRGRSFRYDDLVELNFGIQVSGAITDTTY